MKISLSSDLFRSFRSFRLLVSRASAVAVTSALMLSACGSDEPATVAVFTDNSRFESSVPSNGALSMNGFQLVKKTLIIGPQESFPIEYVYSYKTTPDNIVETLEATGESLAATYEMSSGYISALEVPIEGGIKRTDFSYDANGHFLGYYQGTTQEVRWEYDEKARLTSIKSVHNDESFEFQWPATTSDATVIGYRQEILGNETDANTSVVKSAYSFVYDDSGRIQTLERWSGNNPGEGTLVQRTVFEFDANGNLHRSRTFVGNPSLEISGETRYEYVRSEQNQVTNLPLWRMLTQPNLL